MHAPGSSDEGSAPASPAIGGSPVRPSLDVRSPNWGSPGSGSGENGAPAPYSPCTPPLPPAIGVSTGLHLPSDDGHTDHSDMGGEDMEVEESKPKPRTALQTIQEENGEAERWRVFSESLRQELRENAISTQATMTKHIQETIMVLMRESVLPQFTQLNQRVSSLRNDVDGMKREELGRQVRSLRRDVSGIKQAVGSASDWSQRVETERAQFTHQVAEASLHVKEEFEAHRKVITEQQASLEEHRAEILRQGEDMQKTKSDLAQEAQIHRDEIARQGKLLEETRSKLEHTARSNVEPFQGGGGRGIKIPYPMYNGTKSGAGCHTVAGFWKRFKQAMAADAEQRGRYAIESTQIYLLAGCLRGAAAEWYATQEDGLGLAELEVRMIARFQPVVTLYEMETRLRERKKKIGETMEEYAQALTVISLDGPLESRSGTSLLMAFADGLSNGSVAHPGTVWQSQVYQLVRDAERTHRSVTLTQALEIFSHLPETQQKQIGVKGATKEAKPNRFGLVAYPGTEPHCYQCNQKGHTRRECPETVCYRCRGKGHVSANCPEKENSAGAGNARRD